MKKMQLLIKFFNCEAPLGHTLTVASWDFFIIGGAANSFSVNLHSGSRLLFAERCTHIQGKNLAGLSKGCSSLAHHSGLVSQLCSLESQHKTQPPQLCLGLLAGARRQQLPEIGPT